MKPGRKSAAELEASVVELASTTARPKPTPPEILSTAEQDLFNQLRAANKHLTATDVPMLIAYCQSITQTHRLGRGKNVADWERATRVMMALGTKLKLTPQSDRRVDRTGGIGVTWRQLEEMNDDHDDEADSGDDAAADE